ncbi:MAG: hypothetical protein QXI19_14615, partial [Candidatus Caldarchaeum sp.]
SQRILNFMNGYCPITQRAFLELLSLPSVPNWTLIRDLSTDQQKRNAFKKLIAKTPLPERHELEHLYKLTTPYFRGQKGGKKRSINLRLRKTHSSPLDSGAETRSSAPQGKHL